MTTPLRYTSAFILAFIATLGIFYIMQALISMKLEDADLGYHGKIIDFVKLKEDSLTETRKRKLPDKQKPDEAPPPPQFEMSKANNPDASALSIGLPDSGLDLNLSGPSLGAFDGDSDAVPIVRVQPLYPERAKQRGITGWVDVGFIVTVTGSVRDPFVIASEPSSIFDRSALKAVRKFKYKPKVVDGVAAEQPGQTIRIRFDLDN